MIDIWNKWVQTLIETGGEDSIILAALLVNDKRAFASYYHIPYVFCDSFNLVGFPVVLVMSDLIDWLDPTFYNTCHERQMEVPRFYIKYIQNLYEQRNKENS